MCALVVFPGCIQWHLCFHIICILRHFIHRDVPSSLSGQGMELRAQQHSFLVGWNVALRNPHVLFFLHLGDELLDLVFIKKSLTWATCHNSHQVMQCWNLWKVTNFKWQNDCGRDSSHLHSKFFLFSVVESGLLFPKAEEKTFHCLFPNSVLVTFLCQPWWMRCGTNYISEDFFKLFVGKKKTTQKTQCFFPSDKKCY